MRNILRSTSNTGNEENESSSWQHQQVSNDHQHDRLKVHQNHLDMYRVLLWEDLHISFVRPVAFHCQVVHYNVCWSESEIEKYNTVRWNFNIKKLLLNYRMQLTGTVACWRLALLPLPSVWPHPVIKQTGLLVWSDLTTFRSALNSGGGRQIFWTKSFKVSGVFSFSITMSLVTSDRFHSKVTHYVCIWARAVREALVTYVGVRWWLQHQTLGNIFLVLPLHIHSEDGLLWPKAVLNAFDRYNELQIQSIVR